MAGVVHAGWMTKSPPEKKLRKHFKIFRAQWKKRYFVLRKPSGSLPDQYELHYYKDERCLSKKGTIDLDQCEQIIEALDSDIFPHLLAIKTSYKNKMRTYYLATDTEQDMNNWVQWLCHVCGLKPEDQPTDLPDAKPDHVPPDGQTRKPGQKLPSSNGTPDQIHPPRTGRPSPSPDRERQTNATKSTPSPVPQSKLPSAPPVVSTTAEPPAPSPVVPKRTEPNSTGLQSHKSIYPEQYYNHNLIGGVSVSSQQSKTADGKEQIDGHSDSESEAPPLPEKRHLDRGFSGTSGEGEVFTTVSVYDHPPLSRPAEASDNPGMLYRVPPIPLTQCDRLSVGDARQTTSSHGHSPRSSPSASTDSWTSENVHTAVSASTYDHPHSYLSSSASSDNEFPPERPPKPHHLHSPYQNLPPTGKVISPYDLMSTVPAAPKPHISIHPLGYDIPRQSIPRSAPHTQSMLSYMPSAPHRPPHHQISVDSSHVYLNTTGDNVLKDLNNSSDGAVNHLAGCATDAGWLSQSVPLSRTNVIGEQARSEASHSIYRHPPSSSTSTGSSVRPPIRPSAQGSTTTHRAQNGSQNHQVQEDGSAVIFSSKRTRSFKNPHSLKPVVKQHGPKASGLPLSSMVPAPRPAQPIRTKERSSPEVDEEVRPQEPEEETHHPLSILRPVPAPGSAEPERELKYIDLAMPDSGQEPAARPVHSHTHVHADRGKESVTEYREIDFVKTQALNDTKRLKDKERQHDDHS